MKELEKLEARVGFQGGGEVAQVAAWNQEGTSKMPSRPFMSESVDANAGNVSAMCTAGLESIARGGTAKDALQKLGVMQKALIQDKITSGNFVANDPNTIRQKGSDTPLIDSGTMRGSVTYKAVPRGGSL